MPPDLPAVIPIDDPDDPRIEPYRDVRERDLVGRDGLFIAEGAVVVRGLVQSTRHRTLSLLLADKRVAAMAPLLAQVPTGTPVYSAAQAVLDRIAGFPLHRGILALGARGVQPAAGDLLAACGPVARVVMLFGIGNHDNMGGIFRNAAAFGADAVILDPGCCDPLYRKAIRVSVGAALLVPTARLAADEDALALLDRHGFEAVALSPGGAETLAALAPPRRAALLFGSEGPGLPAALLARARSVRIPMAGSFDSLNVATTSGIVLHHIASGQAA
ncbi:TrmH family RNA methyltransferase [Azospirillum picis]|uniref:tRNA G18 (Ribose-2'-O)-methylase SpoU n=1 Tax=Azospirillum picis TaxID=488438 RepID=A0ABU0MU70_9PROT|nr:RNA methyltransferase [Azospirillum picis]MBP2302977.1 tRNA G18 (ribose-2'-O)-methylase SpoU [Azospirillum picis]MDQ0536729.1 tRNA G18 (ribose-2'-O)-methylase SpoU [Azospirillum picis]